MPSGGWVIKRVHQGHYLPADASPKGSEAGLSRTHAGRGARHGAFPPGPWRGGTLSRGGQHGQVFAAGRSGLFPTVLHFTFYKINKFLHFLVKGHF